jgi:erythromycin esterase
MLKKYLTTFSACLGLAACGGGESSSPVVVPEPVGTTYPDLTVPRLLTDAELASPPPPASVVAPVAAELQWLRDNHRPLRSLVVDSDFSDLAFLETALAGKRIVQLGESSHGAREFNLMKVRVIKYMHERLGYDVLAFESSLMACHLLSSSIPTSSETPAQLTKGCIFGVWHTEELAELFRYIKSTHATARPLRITGFDIQASSGLDNRDAMTNWVVKLTEEVSPGSASQVTSAIRLIYSQLSSAGTSTTGIDTTAAPVVALLKTGAERASADRRHEFETAILAFRALQNRRNYDNEQKQNASNQNTRERGMAEAITGLAERAYPNEKIMVWAHNAHIANNVEYYAGVPPMGAYLKKIWGDQLFTLGLFMLRGQNVGNFRTGAAVQVLAPGRGSLEELAYGLRVSALYLPIERTNQPTSGDDWQHRQIQFRSWGTVDHFDALSANYNAVIMIDHTTIPRYQ